MTASSNPTWGKKVCLFITDNYPTPHHNPRQPLNTRIMPKAAPPSDETKPENPGSQESAVK
jgi:hypothetical protein